MSSNKYYKLLLISILFPVICCFLYFGFITIRETSHNIALERISNDLGIHPTWRSLDQYMLDVLQKGMTREQALQEFDNVSPYVIKSAPNNCEWVEFKPGILGFTSYRLKLCYETDDVQSLKSFRFEDD